MMKPSVEKVPGRDIATWHGVEVSSSLLVCVQQLLACVGGNLLCRLKGCPSGRLPALCISVSREHTVAVP